MRDPQAEGWPDRGERTEDFDEADKWKWEYFAWIKGENRRRRTGAPKDRTLAQAVAEYLEHRRSTTERATWSADRTALNHLLTIAKPSTSFLDVEPGDIQRLMLRLANQGYNPSTLGTYRKSIGVFFRSLGYDATKGVELPNPGKVDIRTLEPGECDKLREAASKIDRTQRGFFPSARLAVEVGLSMGLRQGEIFALRWEAIDPEDKSVRAQWQMPKDGNEPKPLKGKRARTAGILEEWWALHRQDSGYIVGRNGRPVGSRTQRNLITRVLDTAGLNDVGMGWHVLRHTYARHFVERGGWIQELQRSLGHRSIRTTEERYGHFREDVAWKLAKGRIYRLS